MTLAALPVALAAVLTAPSPPPAPATPAAEAAPNSASAPSSTEPPAAPVNPVVRVTRPAFGGKVEIQVFTTDEAAVRPAMDEALAEVARLESLLAEDRPTSDIGRLNLAAGKEAVTIAPETAKVLRRGLEINRLSGGAFALTWLALRGLWDLSPTTEVRMLPGPERIAERLPLVDDAKLVVEGEKLTARLATAGMAVGVSGLAQGYAIHRALATLKKGGVSDALVALGGDIGTLGKHGDRPWLIGIQDPRASGYFTVLPLGDEAIAVTGDYEHFVELEGKRYHHVLDPRTGMPATTCRSVAVVAADAATADALATAVFVLGPEKGLALVEGMKGVGVIIVDADSQVIVSKSLSERARVVRPPTL
jgi:thiamine biosynthesis lipoprotein